MSQDYPKDALQQALVYAGWRGLNDPPNKFRAGWLFYAHAAAAKAGSDLEQSTSAVAADLCKRLHLKKTPFLPVAARVIAEDVAAVGVRERKHLREVEDWLTHEIGMNSAHRTYQAHVEARKRLYDPSRKP